MEGKDPGTGDIPAPPAAGRVPWRASQPILPIPRAQDYGNHPSSQPSPLFSLLGSSLPLSLSFLCHSYFSLFSPFPLPCSGRNLEFTWIAPSSQFPGFLHQLCPPHFHRQRLNGCLAKNFFVLFSLCELPGPAASPRKIGNAGNAGNAPAMDLYTAHFRIPAVFSFQEEERPVSIKQISRTSRRPELCHT